MARLEGYECDNCHKRHEPLGFFVTLFPVGWHRLEVQVSVFGITVRHFCSEECVKAWAGHEDLPQAPRVLFKRWVKAVFHG